VITFITGGGRSGKSLFAEDRAKRYKNKCYVATAIAFDDEMKYRVKKHLEQRGSDWVTIEQYEGIAKALHVKAKDAQVVLVDCLTNLVSNMMIMNRDVDWETLSDEAVYEIEQEILEEVNALVLFGHEFAGEMIIVSNEVGMGLIPEYPLGRRFRDIAGRMNQHVARASDEAYLVVAGLPMKLK